MTNKSPRSQNGKRPRLRLLDINFSSNVKEVPSNGRRPHGGLRGKALFFLIMHYGCMRYLLLIMKTEGMSEMRVASRRQSIKYRTIVPKFTFRGPKRFSKFSHTLQMKLCNYL